jgi:hypothetical protein
VHHQARSGSGRSPQSRSTRRRSQEGNINSSLRKFVILKPMEEFNLFGSFVANGLEIFTCCLIKFWTRNFFVC